MFVLTLTLNIIPYIVASSQQDIYATSTQQSPLSNKLVQNIRCHKIQYDFVYNWTTKQVL